MKVTLEDALSLLSRYADEGTPVRAVLGTIHPFRAHICALQIEALELLERPQPS
jgi:hypothetical protein